MAHNAVGKTLPPGLASWAKADGRLGDAVLKRAGEELAMSEISSAVALIHKQAVPVAQQELLAQMAKEAAEDSFKKGNTAVPNARAAAAETARYVRVAFMHMRHAEKMAKASRTVAAEAAHAAAAELEAQVRREAFQAAERASAAEQASAPQRAKKVAEQVAEAVEPYHLALLRVQKYEAEAEQKARGAARSVSRLVDKAQHFAQSAQYLQATGLTAQAQQMMVMAHSTMNQAVNLRQWALKLHKQASEINDSLGAYQQQEILAAKHAVDMVGESSHPPLPRLLPMDSPSAGVGQLPAR